MNVRAVVQQLKDRHNVTHFLLFHFMWKAQAVSFSWSCTNIPELPDIPRKAAKCLAIRKELLHGTGR